MKKKINVPFSPPDISDLEVAEVCKALKSGWITTGPRTKRLEKLLAGYVGVPIETPNCVCLNSQTACGELSLRLLGIGPQEGGSANDEVITCAYTYTASASVVCHVGAKLVLIDCQKDCLEMDYDALEKAITQNTKAIIPIDLGGVPCDYDRIFKIVNKKKELFKPSNKIQKAIGRIAIIADAAHALGASYKRVMVGNIADFTNFSFHAVKNFTTAEGGAMTWKHIDGISDSDIYHQIQLYSLHGQSKDALKKNQPGMWEYDIVGTWYKCNMTDIMAAIGLMQFERYPNMLLRRKQIIEKYNSSFDSDIIKPLQHYNDDRLSSGHLYITRVFKKNGEPISDEERRKIIIEMAAEGISCNVHYKPLPSHTAYFKLGFSPRDYPNSFKNYYNEITLPLHTCLSDEEISYVISKYKKILEKYI